MVNKYIKYLKSSDKDYSEHTLKAYKNNVSKFFQWLAERYNEKENAAVTSLDIREYQSYLPNIQKYAPAGVQQRILSVLSYCRFLCRNGYLKADITTSFHLIKAQSKNTAPETPLTIEINRFRREVYKRNNLRDIAIIDLLLNTGIRAGELINLEVQDIKISDRKGILHVREGKGKKYRDIPLNSDTRKSLENYIERYNFRGKLWIGQRGYLTQDGLNKMIKRYAERVQLNDKIHPHAIRHYVATRLLREKGVDIATVSNILGHFNINTTKIYVQPTFEDIANALENINV